MKHRRANAKNRTASRFIASLSSGEHHSATGLLPNALRKLSRQQKNEEGAPKRTLLVERSRCD
jgi:hypothetical protein